MRVDQLLEPTRGMVAAATQAMASAHCPYSHYPVGAAILSTSGRLFVGCNVENAAYPLGSCAEAGAIAAMVLAGDRAIAEVVTVTGGDRPGTPCGGCRQRLREFSGPTVRVTSVTTSGAVVSMTMGALLPESFGPEFL